MQYLLDTNICIALIKGHPGIRAKILTIGLENCFVPDISIAELYYGAAKSEAAFPVSEPPPGRRQSQLAAWWA